jgi:hypothetical protein
MNICIFGVLHLHLTNQYIIYTENTCVDIHIVRPIKSCYFMTCVLVLLFGLYFL